MINERIKKSLKPENLPPGPGNGCFSFVALHYGRKELDIKDVSVLITEQLIGEIAIACSCFR